MATAKQAAETMFAYTRTDLAESIDVLYCAGCGVMIDPGQGLMRYLVGLKEGFFFYHEGRCADAALKVATT